MGLWSWTRIGNILNDMKPVLMMISVQIILVVCNIGYKLVANDGISLPILMAYRFIFASAIMVPVAFFVERKEEPKLTKAIVFQTFLCGLFGGSFGQNMYLKGLEMTSATFSAAMTNLIPSITFIIAVCLRLERLGLNTIVGQAKVFGTILGLGGAMLVTFYKGLELNMWKTNINLLEITSSHPRLIGQTSSSHTFGIGALLSIAGCVCYSIWLIIQAKAVKEFPYPYSITALLTVWASVQSVVYALCTERDYSKWAIGYLGFITAVVAGAIGSGLAYTLIAWCTRLRGPVFVTIFNPLLLIILATAGSLFLEEKIHVGLIIGSVLIIGGLYVVLWGKKKEMRQLVTEDTQESSLHSVTIATPHNSSCHESSRQRGQEERRYSHASSDDLSDLYVYI